MLQTEISTMDPKQQSFNTKNTSSLSETTFDNPPYNFDSSKRFGAAKKLKNDSTTSNESLKKSIPGSDMESSVDYDNAIDSLLKNFMSVTEYI